MTFPEPALETRWCTLADESIILGIRTSALGCLGRDQWTPERQTWDLEGCIRSIDVNIIFFGSVKFHPNMSNNSPVKHFFFFAFTVWGICIKWLPIVLLKEKKNNFFPKISCLIILSFKINHTSNKIAHFLPLEIRSGSRVKIFTSKVVRVYHCVLKLVSGWWPLLNFIRF